MTASNASTRLLSSIETALELLEEYHTELSTPPAPFPSLLEQCDALCAQATPQPVRTLHHLAHSGGAEISRCIAALPNSILLSEIDPLARVPHDAQNTPTDMLSKLRHSVRKVPDRVLIRMFQSSVEVLHQELHTSGENLILHSRTHSQFCTEEEFNTQPSLREIVSEVLPVRSVVTLRHPLDAFLELSQLATTAFVPFTLEEFACRATRFLDRHADVPVVLYEDFVADPTAALQQICDILELPFNPLALQLQSFFEPGTSETLPVFQSHTRPPVPDTVEAMRHQSPSYKALCKRFGYTP